MDTLVVAILVLAGLALGAAVLLRALGGQRAEVTELLSAAREGVPAGRSAHEALDPERIAADIEWLADPHLQGRDTPSAGLRSAQLGVIARLRQLGLEPLPKDLRAGPGELDELPALPLEWSSGEEAWRGQLTGYAHAYHQVELGFGAWPLEQPDPALCHLRVESGPALRLLEDFVPLASSSPEDPLYRGEAEGPLVFVGFGIDNPQESYDDFEGVDVAGAIALVLDGEPSQGFAGLDDTAESSIWNKLDALERKGAAGALVVSGLALDFRATRASWMPPDFDEERTGLPALVLSEEAAEVLLGHPPALLRERVAAAPLDAQVRSSLLRPMKRVTMGAATLRTEGPLLNVGGVVRGRGDADRLLVVTAHLDHIGVGPRGRIGLGADDNASGVAAGLAMAAAVAAHPLEADVLFAFPSGEEDGLLGSTALASDLKLHGLLPELCVNLDMVGRGESAGAVVLRGALPADLAMLDGWIADAVEAPGHGLTRVRRVDDPSFFTRSDHYAFFERGVPAIFLFETWPLGRGIYHTWRDRASSVDAAKVARTARLGLAILGAADRATELGPGRETR